MKRKSAFTLVELLVVIGIIAVLISILLPSLNRAREAAKRVTCASQLRQIGLAARAYATENRDLLPPMNKDGGSPYYNISDATTLPAPFAAALPDVQIVNGVATSTSQVVPFSRTISFALWGSAPPAGEAAKPQVGTNLGRLYTRGYLKGDLARLITCPSVAEPNSLTFANDPTKYSFNVHFAARSYPEAASQFFIQPWWKKLSQYGRVKSSYKGSTFNMNQGTAGMSSTDVVDLGGRELALGSDPLITPSTGPTLGWNPHMVGSSRAYNLLFPDGSVKTAIIPNTIDRANNQKIARTLDVLGAAEAIVSGQKPASFTTTDIYVIVPLNP